MAAERNGRILTVMVDYSELAQLMDRLPNRNAFIRRAIRALRMAECPLFGGCGLVPPGIRKHFEAVIDSQAGESARESDISPLS